MSQHPSAAIINSKLTEFGKLSPNAKAAIDAVIDLATTSFSQRPLEDYASVFEKCELTGKLLRCLVICRLNNALSAGKLKIDAEVLSELSENLAELKTILPIQLMIDLPARPEEPTIATFRSPNDPHEQPRRKPAR